MVTDPHAVDRCMLQYMRDEQNEEGLVTFRDGVCGRNFDILYAKARAMEEKAFIERYRLVPGKEIGGGSESDKAFECAITQAGIDHLTDE